jgi:hypothetical protein
MELMERGKRKNNRKEQIELLSELLTISNDSAGPRHQVRHHRRPLRLQPQALGHKEAGQLGEVHGGRTPCWT